MKYICKWDFVCDCRGRYDIKLYPTFLQLHGKTFDYKIPYTTILRLFLLPHKDGRQMFFVVRTQSLTLAFLTVRLRELKCSLTHLCILQCGIVNGEMHYHCILQCGIVNGEMHYPCILQCGMVKGMMYYQCILQCEMVKGIMYYYHCILQCGIAKGMMYYLCILQCGMVKGMMYCHCVLQCGFAM